MQYRLSEHLYYRLVKQLKKDYPDTPAMFAVSWVLKRELGITFRQHSDFIKNSFRLFYYIDVHNEELYTMFVLRYSEFLETLPETKQDAMVNKILALRKENSHVR